MTTEIIIVDDDPLVAEMLATAAAMVGFKTHTYVHAVDFLTHDVSPEDIVLLDLNMPGFDGIEVIRALSASQVTVSLILISGQDRGVLHSAEQLARAHALDVIGSLSKPIQIPSMQRLLLKQFASFRSRRTNERGEERLLPAASEVQKAIRDDQLVVHYQPQIY